MATTKKPVFTPPKSLAACADQLYSTREHRLALQKEADALAAQEAVLREHIINNLPKSNATGIAGRVARATIETKTVYQAKDWDAIHAYILKHQKKNPGVWALMNKALNAKTLKELAEAGTLVDGVESLDVKVVSLSKVGAA